MATYFLSDKDKVETTMYKQHLEDAKNDLDNRLSIEMEFYPKAVEIVEDLIKQYNIDTGPFYLDTHLWCENIKGLNPLRFYVFISNDDQYIISVHIDRETLETGCMYMHERDDGCYVYDFDKEQWCLEESYDKEQWWDEDMDEDEEDECGDRDVIDLALDDKKIEFETKWQIKKIIMDSLQDPTSSISEKVAGLIKKEVDDTFMPIVTVKEKGNLEADITKLHGVEDNKEYIALISSEGLQESEECILTESEDCAYSPSFYTGTILIYNEDVYSLCQCVCVKKDCGWKPDACNWREVLMDEVDDPYQVFIRTVEKTEDFSSAMKMTRYHFNKMSEAYYDYEDGEKVVLPLSESAYISFNIDECSCQTKLKGRRKKMTEKEKTLCKETSFIMKKIWTEGDV